MANKKNIVRRIKSAVMSVSDKSKLRPLLPFRPLANKFITHEQYFLDIYSFPTICLAIPDEDDLSLR